MADSLNNDPFIKLSMKVIAALLVVALLLPIFALFGMYGAVNHSLRDFQMGSVTDGGYGNSQRAKGLVSGDDPAALKALQNRLISLTAQQAEISKVRKLNLIFVESSGDSTFENADTRLGTVNTAIEITLNADQDFSEGAVFVTDKPVLFTLGEGTKGQRSLFAYDGPYAFDIKNASPGILSGFRAAVFGARKTATIEQLKGAARDKKLAAELCDTIAAWRDYYGVTSNHVRLWRVINATEFTLKNQSITSENVKLKGVRAPLKCKN